MMEKYYQLYILLVSEIEENADCIILLPESKVVAKYDNMKIEYNNNDVTVSVNRNVYRKVNKRIIKKEVDNVHKKR